MFVENLKETLNLGKKLSHKLNPQSIVLLQGPIGAGKTSFIQGIAKALLISEDITSPTFALSHHYNSGKLPLIHLDLYRLKNISSAKEVFPAPIGPCNKTIECGFNFCESFSPKFRVSVKFSTNTKSYNNHL